MNGKTGGGRFFEDFRIGQELIHATPRTITEGDAALYLALFGSRFAINSSAEFARRLGLEASPIDDLLVFNIILGKTVADVSLNAISNLGYADGRFGAPVYPGDTIDARSRVLGLRETSGRESGIVYLRSEGANQRGETVASYVRWVLLPKRDPTAPAPAPSAPDLPATVPAEALSVPAGLDPTGYDAARAGGPWLWEDYEPGECIDHAGGVTVEDAEHMMFTRLCQNAAPIHFDARRMRANRFGRRVAMGGHVIALARALTFDDLPNAFKLAAINAGRHTAPSFGGDTIRARTEILHRIALPGRDDLGALRLRTVATKNRDPADFADRDDGGRYDPSVVLDLDYTVLMPRRFRAEIRESSRR